MRIGGLASGIDTDQIIRNLMQVERIRMDRLLQQEQRIKWRQESYNDVNRKMANFILNTRNDFSGSQNPINPGTVSRFNWVKSASSSNEGIVKVNATAEAMNGAHSVHVKQLAEVASITSLNFEGMLDADGVTFNTSGEFTIKTHAHEEGITVNIGSEEGNVKTISDLVRAINNAITEDGTNLGLRAAYDSALGQLMINTRETGEASLIQLEDTSGSFVSTMFGSQYTDLSTGLVKGQDAEIYFNGSSEVITKSTNNFSIFGINLQLQSVSPLGTNVTINVNANTEGIFEKVESFVKSYNELVDEINGILGQKFHRDFPPLTDEQKRAMTDDDIKLWEEKSKSGLLKNDEGLTRILRNMRTSLYQVVEGTIGDFKHITDIGIDTGPYQDRGKLVINEERLRSAISKDPEGIVNILFKTSSTVVPTEGTEEEINAARQQRASETGLIQRVYDDMVIGMKDVIRRSGHGSDAILYRRVQSNLLLDFVTSGGISSIDRDITSIKSRLEREERVLNAREARYWNQFSAMEKAMNMMQQQSSWLMSQMGMNG